MYEHQVDSLFRKATREFGELRDHEGVVRDVDSCLSPSAEFGTGLETLGGKLTDIQTGSCRHYRRVCSPIQSSNRWSEVPDGSVSDFPFCRTIVSLFGTHRIDQVIQRSYHPWRDMLSWHACYLDCWFLLSLGYNVNKHVLKQI